MSIIFCATLSKVRPYRCQLFRIMHTANFSKNTPNYSFKPSIESYVVYKAPSQVLVKAFVNGISAKGSHAAYVLLG